MSQHFQLASDRDRVVYLGVARSASHNVLHFPSIYDIV